MVHHPPAPQWSLHPARLHDSIRVHLCPGSPHHPGAAHWSVVCHLQHQVPSSRHVLDLYITERKSWLICEGVKGFLILVSLVLFSCVSRHYRYRQRDEIVNVQAMIEDTHERWLDQEEEYMQEQREFYQKRGQYNNM